ncbi:hypothetical protein LX87_05178 [Larkinella arboricola]|uniref:Uncharacterized protein n=1 Tax=Larkinella arboricola TaxID=643671 RepID=A0A327WTY5_LARAB|nr:hypothetical protein [Larkinella arboricola]RAJ92210.1 hypothetical protein LX87_05178 [Larkinella arboricola]
MKTWNYARKRLWILLIVCPLSNLCGQSTGGITAETDSAIRAEFLANAKKIHADLIRGDFAQHQAEKAQADLQDCKEVLTARTAENDQLKDEVKQSQQTATAEADRRKKYQREAWGWRGLAALAVYLLIK